MTFIEALEQIENYKTVKITVENIISVTEYFYYFNYGKHWHDNTKDVIGLIRRFQIWDDIYIEKFILTPYYINSTDWEISKINYCNIR